jgi:hypothetical protein
MVAIAEYCRAVAARESRASSVKLQESMKGSDAGRVFLGGIYPDFTFNWCVVEQAGLASAPTGPNLISLLSSKLALVAV